MNKYTPENMVRGSRYAAYFPTLSEDLQKKVYARIARILKENGDYCDKGNVKHMGAIATSISIKSSGRGSARTWNREIKTDYRRTES